MGGRQESDNIANNIPCNIHSYSFAISIGAIDGIVDNNVNQHWE